MTRFGRSARLVLTLMTLPLALSMIMGSAAHADGDRDLLFVGDGIDNNVEVFDAFTGTWRRSLHPEGLLGPRGIVHKSGNLFLVNQNVGLDVTGEILRFNASGRPLNLKRVVPACPPAEPDCNAPFAPRGMILWHNHLFVANAEGPPVGDGNVLKYTLKGVLKATLAPPAEPPKPLAFHAFAVVIGPRSADALRAAPGADATAARTPPGHSLYVSSRFSTSPTSSGGQVLEFDPDTGDFIKVFISNDGSPTSGSPTSDCTDLLTRPEGLVFGPDGRLYITSARASEDDSDRILIFQGPGGRHPGACVGRIDLDKPGADDTHRSTAQTLLFGPGGDLFVPISNAFAPPDVAAGKDRGAIRRYRIGCRPISSKSCFDYFVSPGGRLGQGWYLTFGETRPGTLAYDD